MTSKLKLYGAVISKCLRIRRALVVVIMLLHALITINFAVEWSYEHSAFIENGKSFWTTYSWLNGPSQSGYLVGGITASMSTILTDLYMVCVTLLGIHVNSSHSES